MVSGSNNAIQLTTASGSAATADIEGNFLKSDKYTVNLNNYASDKITFTDNVVVAGSRGHLGHFQGDASGNFWAAQGATPDASGNMTTALTEPIADTGAEPGANEITSYSYYSTAVVHTSAAQWVALDDHHATSISYNDFVEALYANNGSFNGNAAAYDAFEKDEDGRLVVMINPAAGDWSAANCTAQWATPYRLNDSVAQLQLFHSTVDARKGKDTTGVTDVSVQNVAFVVAGAASGSVTGGYNSFELASAKAYQLYLMNDGNVTFDNCGFDGVGLAVYNRLIRAAGYDIVHAEQTCPAEI